MHQWEEKSAVVGGNTMVYRENGQGHVVVFLHGLEGVGPALPLLDQLAQKYQVLAPDLPGFGKSQRPAYVETVRDMGYQLLDFLNALAVSRPSLVAASLGGWLAADLMVDYWNAFKGAALIAPLGLGNGTEGPLPDIFRLRPLDYASLLVADDLLIQHLVKDWEENLHGFLQEREMVARLAWHPRLYDPKLARRLTRIGGPVLVISGDADRLVTPAVAKDYAGALAGGLWQGVSTGRHALAMSHPEMVSSSISDFLQNVVGVSAHEEDR